MVALIAGLLAKAGLSAGLSMVWAFIKPYFTLRNILIAVGAVALITAGITFWYQRHEIASLSQKLIGANGQITTLQNVNRHNAETMQELAADDARKQRLYQERQSREAVTKKSADSVKKELNDAPATDDGPIAPVLERALEWMPE